ncbi:MAG: DUF4157 domain-containing protein [Thermoanaerobaculia bacterium]|nr:DUF4157 domain-containing protein [Thermoanaerobaculia bacterium]
MSFFARKISKPESGHAVPAEDKAKPAFFQPKLTVNAPGDELEQEADAMGERVMRMAQAGETPVQRSPQHGKGCACPHCSARPDVQRQADESAPAAAPEMQEDDDEQEETAAAPQTEEAGEQEPAQEPLQAKSQPANPASTGAFAAPPGLSAALADTKGSGSAMPADTRSFMEHSMGADFSQVRLHTDEKAAEMNESVQARAFTHGQHIYFNKGEYQPESPEGKRLLAHELTHVTQQNGGHTIRRFLGKVWGGIKKAAGWVGDKVKKGVKAIGKGAKWLGGKIASGAKWLGGKIWEGAKWLGDKVWRGVKWFGKQLIDKIAGVFQRVARWITQLPARVGRLLKGLLEGLKSFKPWTLDWWKSLAKADTWKNFLKWAGARLIDILEIAGLGEAYETIMDFIKFNTRTLNAAERTAAARIFGTSINLDLVRVDEAAVIGPAFSGRAYTSFHTINSWGREPIDVMMHELTHVWQYETSGAIYMPQAIHAQVWGAGYKYNGAAGLLAAKNAGKGFRSFNREQQGQIIQNFYNIKTTGSSQDSDNPATTADLPLYVDFVVAVSTLSKSQLLVS